MEKKVYRQIEIGRQRRQREGERQTDIKANKLGGMTKERKRQKEM